MSSDCDCKSRKRVREHVASLLPFKVFEAADGKPVGISGVAMAAGNREISTSTRLMSCRILLRS